MGVHAIDTARFLLGDPLPARVRASIGRAYGSYDDRIDDDGVVLIDWDNGVRSVIECGWWQPALDGIEAETDVYGTGGHARIWPEFVPNGPPRGYDHCALPMYQAQMADFLACCRSGAMPVASADVGVEAMRVVEAAYASSHSDEGAL
jgi:predicted dehydrogenase